MELHNLARNTLARCDEIENVLRFDKLKRSAVVAGCGLLAFVSGQLGVHKYQNESTGLVEIEIEDFDALQSSINIPNSTSTTVRQNLTTTSVPEQTTTTTSMPEILRAASANCRFEILSTKECINPVREPFSLPLKRFESDNSEEIQQIYDLLDMVNPTPAGYEQYKIDTSRSHRLDGILSGEAIWPEYSVNHWVGYPTLCTSVDNCIDRMLANPKHLSYQFLTMGDGSTSLLAPAPHARADHALGANYVSVGSAGNANNISSLTPEMLTSMIYLELWMDHEYNRQMERDRSLSHAEVQRQDDSTKIDWPSQLQDGLFARKLKLNHEVYILGMAKHPSPLNA